MSIIEAAPARPPAVEVAFARAAPGPPKALPSKADTAGVSYPVDVSSTEVEPIEIPPNDVGSVSAPVPQIPVETAPTRVVWSPASVVGGASAWQVGTGSASWLMHAGQPDLFPPVLAEIGVVADLDDWLEGFTLTVLEVLSARRPARQLDLVLTIPVRMNIKRSINANARLELVSVRGQRTGGRAIEASAHIRVGGRSVAAAFRLAHNQERWVCTAWQMRVQDLQRASAA